MTKQTEFEVTGNEVAVKTPEVSEVFKVEAEDDDTQITVTLSKGIERSDGKTIKKIIVTEPTPAELNKVGGRLSLLQMSDAAYAQLLPKITQPQITPNMFNKMRLKDSQKLINAVITFLADSTPDELIKD